MANTTYGAISQRTAAYAAVKMLEHARPIIVLADYGQTRPVPMNKAAQIKFRRPVPFDVNVATAALAEGVIATPGTIQYDDVAVTLGGYGDVRAITDVVADMSEDPVLNDAAELSGEHAAEILELVTWGVIKGGTNVIYGPVDAVGGVQATSRATTGGAFTRATQRAATRSLKSSRARKITTKMSSSVNYNTEPVDAAFIAFAHTDMEGDIRDLVGFVPTEKYGSMKALPNEIGKCEDVRYILSPVLESFPNAGDATPGNVVVNPAGTAADVYPIIIVAKEAYGCVPLRGKEAIKPTVLNPGTPSKSDPLGQIGYVGWKAYYAAVRLNESWMVRIETCASESIVTSTVAGTTPTNTITL